MRTAGNKQDQTQYRYFFPMDRGLGVELDKALTYGQRRPFFSKIIDFTLDLHHDDRNTFQALADGRISVQEAVERWQKKVEKLAEWDEAIEQDEPPDEPTTEQI